MQQNESKKLDPRQISELNRQRELESREISELNKQTSILNHKLNDLTSKRDLLSKNINDYDNDQKLLEKQRLEDEKRIKREQALAEKKEKLNISHDSDRPKKKKAKKGDVIDDIVTRFMEENDLKLPFEWKAEGK